MPTFLEGDLWDALGQVDLLLVTTNATLRRADNALVMGRGAAAEMAGRWPALPKLFGAQIAALGESHYLRHDDHGATRRVPYDILCRRHPDWPAVRTMLGIFQVKFHFRAPALPALIALSAATLNTYLFIGEAQQERALTVAMNFPGIGFGQLTEATVRPILDPLPPTVRIYQKEEP